MVEAVLFVLMAVAALAGAVTVVVAKNPIYSAIGLLGTLAAGVARNTPENLRAWIDDPDRLKPGARMPAMRLSGHDLDQLVTYLLTLR